MALIRFPDWLLDRKTANILPAHQRVMALLSMSGTGGMPYSSLAQLSKLPPRELRALLDALVRSGEVAVTRTKDDVPVYRRLI